MCANVLFCKRLCALSAFYTVGYEAALEVAFTVYDSLLGDNGAVFCGWTYSWQSKHSGQYYRVPAELLNYSKQL